MSMHVTPKEFKPTRRALLRAAPAAGLTAMMAGAVPAEAAEPDPHPAWLSAWQHLTGIYDEQDLSEAEEQVVWDSREELAVKLATTPAKTVKGLYAQLTYIEADLNTYIADMVCAPFERALVVARDSARGLI